MQTDLIKPKPLGKGDTIGIVAPASSFDADNFKKGVKKLRSRGYKIKYERSIFSQYWSRPGHDKKRAEQINRMFADEKVKAILCAKGGYGSIDIIPYLDADTIRANPKIFVGYSDMTHLLLYLQHILRVVVFHGPVVSGEIFEGMNELTLDCLFKLITQDIALGPVTTPQLKALSEGRVTGNLTGGNMSSIIETIGTDYEINTDEKILFLEDIGEDLVAIENYSLKLREAGKFSNIKGIVFGRMVNCFEVAGVKRNTADILKGIFSDIKVPMLFGFPSGHIQNIGDIHFTLPLGVEVTIETDVPALVINEAAVQ